VAYPVRLDSFPEQDLLSSLYWLLSINNFFYWDEDVEGRTCLIQPIMGPALKQKTR
jgi:hypothetical protein